MEQPNIYKTNPPINCTFSSELFLRLTNYAKRKGLKEQEVIRFAVAMFLDKLEGKDNSIPLINTNQTT